METPELKPALANEGADNRAAEVDYHEPTKEELLAELRNALRQAIAGEEGMPARESIEALRDRVYRDADHG